MAPVDTRQIGKIFIDLGVIRQGQLQAALAEQRRSGGRLGQILLEREMINEEDLSRALAMQKGMDWLPAAALKASDEALGLVDAGTARAFGALPLEVVKGQLRIAVSDPDVLPLLGDLEALTGFPMQVVLAEDGALREAVERCYIQRNEAQVKAEVQAGEAAPIVRLLESLLTRAVRDGAADIHFEPYQGEFRIRMRVDGVLYEVDPPPQHLATALISRVKVLANLDISETRMPQDGRIEMTVDGRKIDFRVSTVPIQGGESTVLRVLDRKSLRLELTDLGLLEREVDQLDEFIRLPHGIVLVTGPTGSGKTTTLYSLLNRVNEPKTKILTVEDPVEYDLDGIVQVPTNEDIGVNYSRVLRTMLRQDPDIILVGEIRDPETAQIAVEASLTGHLVLSTLHTNDAPSTITRMIDLGVEPFLLAATIEGIVAQRLLRSVCQECRIPWQAPEDMLKKAGLTADQQVFRGKGCEICHFTGYKGRSAIYEILPMDDALREQFLRNPSTIALRELARERKMMTLRERAIELALNGKTTLDEVLRETQVDNF
ncbi:MAG: Flp pilus assembly complex ATPase component TadA [Planctomycetes bacterium]|nr:Flp pilus assembly complex ATPase component TadA [Planctomycetota bacterium]NQU47058.1 Flp pilus assembly complex ATPase component TadA [Planctomycetota bacterium]